MKNFLIYMMAAALLVGCSSSSTPATEPLVIVATEPSAEETSALAEYLTDPLAAQAGPDDTFKTSAPFPSFTTTDLEGNEVTEAIFGDYDLTIVNIWGTYCGPCINEMPELAQWYTELPEGVNMIGLVCDVLSPENTTGFENAQKIVEATGVTYTNILASEDMLGLLTEIIGVPTTIFIDKDGMILDDVVVGAYVDSYKTILEKYYEP